MSTVVMRNRDEWDDENRLVGYLAGQLRSGRLGLALGAGISAPFSLPGWKDLVDGMFQESGVTREKGSLEQQAEHIRRKAYVGDTKGYCTLVHKVLYANADRSFEALRKNATIASVGALLMASRRGSASEVVTINFDDILETYLRYFGFVVNAVALETHWSTACDVAIYHPHGFLPYNDSDSWSNDVVLDQESFGRVIGANTVWRQVCMNMFRRRTCLFVGMSGDDRNIDSMLLQVRDEHAAAREGTPFWGVTFSMDGGEMLKGQWEARGVYFKRVSDYHSDLPRILFRICQRAAEDQMTRI